MTAPEPLAELRARRDALRDDLTGRVERIKHAVAETPIPARVKHEAEVRASTAIEQGVDLAKESKGVIAGGVGLIAAWFARNRILVAVRAIGNRFRRN